MKCSSCGSSQFKTLENYLVCRHCGSQISIQKNHDSRAFIVVFIIILLVLVWLFTKQDNLIPEQAIQIEKTEQEQEKRNSSLVINNTQAKIGTQTIITENGTINIDNTQAHINTQTIKQHKSDATSKEYKEMLKTKKEMAEMDRILHLKDKKRIAQEYEKRHKNRKSLDNHKSSTKLLSVSSTTYSKDGKVLKSFSHEYNKNSGNSEPCKVVSTNSGYVINNEKRDLKRQEFYYNKEKSSKFMSIENEKN